MPFQSNPNAGGFDSTILSLLFAERDKRRAAERQAMLDQAKAQQDALKFAMEQAKAEREERRAEALFREDLREKQFNNMAKLASAVGSAEESAAAVPPEILRQTQQEYLASQAPGNAVLMANMTGSEDAMRALNQLAGSDPQAAIRQGQQTEAAVARASSLTGDPVTDRLYDMLEQDFGITRDQLRTSGNVERARGMAAEAAKTEADLAQKQAETDIQERKERRLANEAEGRLVQRTGRQIAALGDQIAEQQRIMATSPPNSAAYRRASLLAARLESAMTRKLTEGVDPGHFVNMQNWMNDEVALVQEAETATADLEAFLKLAEQNPNFLGTTRGGLTQFYTNILEGAREVSDVTGVEPIGSLANLAQSSVNLLMSDSALSDDVRQRLSEDMRVDAGATLQARSDVKALSSRIAYIVTRANNPGRFSIKEYEMNLERLRADRGTAAQSIRQLRTGLAEMRAAYGRVRNRVSSYQKVMPGVMGGLVGPGGETVLPPEGRTDFATFNGNRSGEASTTDSTGLDVQFGPSGLPLLTEPKPARPGKHGVPANRYMELSPEEKSAYIEKLLRESR